MTTAQWEAQVLKKQSMPRMEYDIAKNSIKRIAKLYGKAGLLAVVVVGCELSDAFKNMEKGETK